MLLCRHSLLEIGETRKIGVWTTLSQLFSRLLRVDAAILGIPRRCRRYRRLDGIDTIPHYLRMFWLLRPLSEIAETTRPTRQFPPAARGLRTRLFGSSVSRETVEIHCSRSESSMVPLASLLVLALGAARASVTPASNTLCPCPTNESPIQAPAPSSAAATSNSGDMITSWNWSWHWSRKPVLVRGVPCFCDPGARPTRDDYVYTAGIGSHKLHTRALVWNEARKMCSEEGGHLAIINSLAEAHVLVEIFNASGPVKGASYTNVAFLGIHDLYKEGEWVTILGESLARTGYAKWSDKWGGQPDNGQGKQHCGVFINEGALDDVACDVPFAFFCELPDFQIPR